MNTSKLDEVLKGNIKPTGQKSGATFNTDYATPIVNEPVQTPSYTQPTMTKEQAILQAFTPSKQSVPSFNTTAQYDPNQMKYTPTALNNISGTDLLKGTGRIGGNLYLGAVDAGGNLANYGLETIRQATPTNVTKALSDSLLATNPLLLATKKGKEALDNYLGNKNLLLDNEIAKKIDDTYTQGATKSLQPLQDFLDKGKANRQALEQQNIENQNTPVGKYLSRLAPSIGNNLVGMTANAVNPVLGSGVFMGSAAGSYLDDAKNRGMNDEQAYKYATVMGALEGGTEQLTLGNLNKGLKALRLGGLSTKVLENFGINLAENFVQEATMEPLQEIFAKHFGGTYDFSDIGSRMISSGIDGAVSALILQGAGSGIASCLRIVDKASKGQQVTQEEINVAKNDLEKIVALDGATESQNATLEQENANVENNTPEMPINTGLEEISQNKPLLEETIDNISNKNEKGLKIDDTNSKSIQLTNKQIDNLFRDYGSDFEDNYSKAYITKINVNDFIDLTSSKENLSNLENETTDFNIDQYRNSDNAMFLEYDIDNNEIVGHEGRHRAIAMRNAGIEEIPVVIKPNSEKGKYNRTKIDNLQVKGQDFGNTKSEAVVDLNNLLPISKSNIEEIRNEFAPSSTNETLANEKDVNNIIDEKTTDDNGNTNSIETKEEVEEKPIDVEEDSPSIIKIKPKEALDLRTEAKRVMDKYSNETRNKQYAYLDEENTTDKDDDVLYAKTSSSDSISTNPVKEAVKEQKLADDIYFGNKMAKQENKFSEMVKQQREKAKQDKDNQKLADDIYFGNKLVKQKNKTNERLDNLKEKYNDKLVNQKEFYKNRLEQNKIKQKTKEINKKLEKIVDDLSKKTIAPRQTKHNEEGLMSATAKVLETLDMTKNDNLSKKNLRLAELKNEYRKLFNSDYTQDELEKAGQVVFNYDEDVINVIDNLEGKRVNDLTLEEKEQLYNVLKAMEHTISTAGKVRFENKMIEVDELANRSRELLDKYDDKDKYIPAIRSLKDFFSYGIQRPMTFLKISGQGYLKNDLLNAQDKKITLINEGIDIEAKAKNKNVAKALKEPAKVFTLKNGNKVSLTKAQVMTLYESMKDEQAKNHILNGGFRPSLIKEGIKNRKQTINEVTENDVKSIIETLTDEEKKYADTLGTFINTKLSDEYGLASIRKFGYNKAKRDGFYFPIRTDSATRNTQFEVYSGENSSMSITKDRIQGAKNAIVLDDIRNVYAKHINDVATFSAFSDVIDTYTKILNYKRDFNYNEYMRLKLGDEAFNVARRLIQNIQNDKTTGEKTLANKLTGTLLSSQVAYNISSAAKQWTAIAKATYSDMKPKYLFMGFNKTGKYFGKNIVEEMYKYSPIARYKDLGFNENDIARNIEEIIKDEGNVIDKVKEVGYVPMEKVDEFTWAGMWQACKYEYADKSGKKIKDFNENDFKKINERFREIIAEAQVVDTPLHKSDVIKNSSDLQKLLLAYKNEPLSLISILEDSIWEAKYNNNTKAIGKAVYAVATNLAFDTLVGNLIYGLRHIKIDDGDDDDKNKALGFVADMFENFATGIPYVDLVYNALKGYENKNMSTSLVTDLTQSLYNTFDRMLGNGENKKSTDFKVYKEALETILIAMGISAKNIDRDFIDMPIRLYLRQTKNYEGYYNYLKTQVQINDTGASEYYDLLYLAYKNDLKAYNKIKADLIDNGRKETSIDTAIKNREKKENTELASAIIGGKEK